MGREDSGDDSSGRDSQGSSSDAEDAGPAPAGRPTRPAPDVRHGRLPAASAGRVARRTAVAVDEVAVGAAAGDDSAGSTDTVELDQEQEQVIAQHGSRGNSVASSRASSVTRYSGGSEAENSSDEVHRTSPLQNAVRPCARRSLQKVLGAEGAVGVGVVATVEVESSLAPTYWVGEASLGRRGARSRASAASADSEDSNPEGSESTAEGHAAASNPAGAGSGNRGPDSSLASSGVLLPPSKPHVEAAAQGDREAGVGRGTSGLAYESPRDVAASSAASSDDDATMQSEAPKADVAGAAAAAAADHLLVAAQERDIEVALGGGARGWQAAGARGGRVLEAGGRMQGSDSGRAGKGQRRKRKKDGVREERLRGEASGAEERARGGERERRGPDGALEESAGGEGSGSRSTDTRSGRGGVGRGEGAGGGGSSGWGRPVFQDVSVESSHRCIVE